MNPVGPGSRLGPYEIVALAGAGGMGQVYKARDTRLDRTVAIKILPPELAADPQFRERFDREARVISQLDHPHICTLYDVGEADDIQFLVLQYLEGETLADRLSKGPLTVDETLQIALQIGAALDLAHGAGIVHRDLKPGNVMLTAAGVKLLDFGLAKTTASVSSTPLNVTSGPTISSPMTAQGTILGTFQYMSPEQIEGHDADARTDIFAFGCVLYEMLTGKKAFEGKTQGSLIAAILERTPVPIPMLQPVTPPALAHIVDECLRKNPARRWASIHDVALELEWIAEEGAGAIAAAAAAAPPPKSRARSIALGIVSAAAVVAAAVAAWLLKPAPSSARDVARFSIVLPEGVNFSRAGRHVLTVAPDGSKVVFVANQQLYVRALDQDTAVPIRGTNVDPADPTFSPDGAWVAFWSNNQIRKVSIAGGSPVTVSDAPIPFGLYWNGDRIFIGAGPRGILAVPAAGGATTEMVPGKSGEFTAHPQLLPDGDSLLFTLRSRPNWNDAQIVVESLTSHRRKVILQGGSNATFLPTGHLVFAHDNALYAEAFDPRAQEVRGGPIAVVDDVAGVGANSGPIGAAQVAISRTGIMAYLPGNLIGGRRLVWVDRAGTEESIPAPARVYFTPRISPDGSRLAVEARDEEADIWVWDFGRSTLTRLTFGPSSEGNPVWTPDGRRIIYASNREGAPNLYWQAADGTGEAERLTKSSQLQTPHSTSPDGKWVVFREFSKSGGDSNLLALTLDGDRTPRTLLATPAGELNGEISPDGRWMVYESTESGRVEIYVRPWPSVADGRWQVSNNGGQAPAWSHDGRELFYIAADNQLMAVVVETKRTFVAGEARKLFDTSKYVINVGGRAYDVTPDGKRFVLSTNAVPRGVINRIAVVANWFEELKAKVPNK